MSINSEFEGKRQQALDALAEASARLQGGQFWLAARKSAQAETNLREMIATLQGVLNINETATLLTDSLADEKRQQGERAIVILEIEEGGSVNG